MNAPEPGRRGEIPAARLDALLPPEMAERAEEIGVRKAGLDLPRLFTLAVLAGAFIALGGVFATTALAGAGAAPWGPVRVLAGAAFSLGLILVVVGGAELFTGNNLVVMAWASGRVSSAALLRNWVVVFVGNFAGATATALAVCLAGTQRGGEGAFGVAAFAIAHAKLQPRFFQAVVLGVLCNALVCLAVWLTYSARTTADRILAIVPPISAFVAAGFEHSIANMYFVPYAMFVAAFDPDFVTGRELGSQAQALTWATFLGRNLLPVTIGNIIGGSVLVGAVYWFAYLRQRGPMSRSRE
ncbi:MAG TPA: formate/nitrite transporter family protein [Methylomirabilota bacterium]|nr:formate/nitrite transporter family protein [Methylomirabilota bacterium]